MCWNTVSSASQMTVHNPKDTATIANQSAEIVRLKTELELRTKERDQATKHMEIADNEVHILKEFVGYAQIGNITTVPDLFAHLVGRGE